MSHMLNVRWRHRWRDITPGVGWVNFLGESQSRIYPNMCAKFGCGPAVVEKKGGDRQTKGHCSFIIVYIYAICTDKIGKPPMIAFIW